MRTWPQRLKDLQVQLGKTAEEMAMDLGITERTWKELVRPQQTRPPSQRIQIIVSGLERSIAGGPLPTLDGTPSHSLNLVIIHSDVIQVDDVGKLIDRFAKPFVEADQSEHLINEFHYVAVNVDRDMPTALSVMQTKRGVPHFFTPNIGLQNTEEAQSTFFSTTAAWLVSKAEARNLSQVVFVAPFRQFWPLAIEIKTLSVDSVRVSFLNIDPEARPTEVEVKAFEGLDLYVSNLANRHHGRVVTLNQEKKFGFLEYVRQEPDPRDHKKQIWIKVASTQTFFHANHMRKAKNGGQFETPFEMLTVGDIVSFDIGINHRRPCAADVALIAKGAEGNRDENSEVLELLKDSIMVWADEQGWALLSNVGNRATVLNQDFKSDLKKLGYERWSDLLKEYPNIFEISDSGDGTNHRAACVRLR